MECSWKEEVANALTHGLGVLLSIPALVILLISAYGDVSRIISFAIFGASMIVLYVCSTLLHSLFWHKGKRLLQIFDHSAIFLLIAGTYTPFTLLLLRGALGWTLFGIVWGLAVVGIVFKIFFVDRFVIASTVVYIFMGWLAVIAIRPLYELLKPAGFSLLLGGGILYTIGAIFFLWKRLPYHHAIWHVFVLGGSAMMYFCVLFYI
ncbi:PAQR family membrane homeostasis protein TrhA [Thermaerobacillus caldiproteolyticus]|uniref:Hemolysin III n=1 Tax=Thermaerobacillus caldiproteolyticus TaxID=247480 RepID=A0A7V9Z896_9BACL|nr:hemolysin III family protein [Anoxybacillus caldiproteolyticus]MBA2875883.1 hemolysin III [Anoxybacillus caldiproteolyticus]QPA32468.1 hemolysin III family protein [Anoxybacillus caldiproteolyticus]